jgi:hypothetical protein
MAASSPGSAAGGAPFREAWEVRFWGVGAGGIGDTALANARRLHGRSLLMRPPLLTLTRHY